MLLQARSGRGAILAVIARLVPLALLVLGPASDAGAAEGRRVALVVGNGAYAETAALPNPPNDARAVAAALRGLGFEVLEAADLDHPAMLEALAGFAERLEGARVGLFFYAGHGLQVAGENYLVPVNARLGPRPRCGCRPCRYGPCSTPWRRRCRPGWCCWTPAATTRSPARSPAAWARPALPRSAKGSPASRPGSAR